MREVAQRVGSSFFLATMYTLHFHFDIVSLTTQLEDPSSTNSKYEPRNSSHEARLRLRRTGRYHVRLKIFEILGNHGNQVWRP